jgi:transcriptional regulator with PAS, ATPase and Fis domain
LILSDGNVLTADDFAMKIGAAKSSETLQDSSALNLEENEKMIIENALRISDGSQSKAAELLGISRDALKHRIKKHGIILQKVVE